MWARMILRVHVQPLSLEGRRRLFQVVQENREAEPITPVLSVDDLQILREARSLVEVPDEIFFQTEEIIGAFKDEGLAEDATSDDRRFRRAFEVMQARALLMGRPFVNKGDLKVLQYLYWDDPDEIVRVKEIVAPHCKTPLVEAEQIRDDVLDEAGPVMAVLHGNGDVAEAVEQLKTAMQEIDGLARDADPYELQEINKIKEELESTKDRVKARVVQFFNFETTEEAKEEV